MTVETYTLPTILDDSYLDSFEETVKYDYNNGMARVTLGERNYKISSVDGIFVSSVDGSFAGSSPFIQLHLLSMGENKEQLPNKTKLVQRPELERTNALDSNFLPNKYTDIGIAIWSKPETFKFNEVAYQRLINQFKQRNIPLGNGKLVYFSELAKPIENNDSGYGLVFDLKDIETKNLEESIKDIDEFDWYSKKENGLARVSRGFTEWICDNDDLRGSNCSGRIFGVKV